MDVADYLSRFDWDHVIFNCIDGRVPHFTKITPRVRADHREKTRRDIKQIAKGKRLAKAQAAHREVLARKGLVPVDVTGAKDDGANAERPKSKRKWPSRPFPKRKRRA
jgi:hypothetical protein